MTRARESSWSSKKKRVECNGAETLPASYIAEQRGLKVRRVHDLSHSNHLAFVPRRQVLDVLDGGQLGELELIIRPLGRAFGPWVRQFDLDVEVGISPRFENGPFQSPEGAIYGTSATNDHDQRP